MSIACIMICLNITLDPRLGTDPTGMEEWIHGSKMEAQNKLTEFLSIASMGGWHGNRTGRCVIPGTPSSQHSNSIRQESRWKVQLSLLETSLMCAYCIPRSLCAYWQGIRTFSLPCGVVIIGQTLYSTQHYLLYGVVDWSSHFERYDDYVI